MAGANPTKSARDSASAPGSGSEEAFWLEQGADAESTTQSNSRSLDRSNAEDVEDHGSAPLQIAGIDIPLELVDFVPEKQAAGTQPATHPANPSRPSAQASPSGSKPVPAQQAVSEVPAGQSSLPAAQSVPNVLVTAGPAGSDLPAQPGLGKDGRPSVFQLLLSKLPNPLEHPVLFVRQVLKGIFWLIRASWGMACLVVLLAVIVVVPGLNFLVLGYLLEVEGRVARSGRIRDAFPLIQLAPRLGSIIVGVLGWLFPLQLLASASADARLIDPGSPADRNLHLLVFLFSVGVAIHLCLALARGGSLMSFVRPIKNFRWLLARFMDSQYWSGAEQSVKEFVAGLQLKHHFWLGLRGYLGAMIWLIIPTAFFAAANKTQGAAVLVTLFGGFLLMLVFSWVPFLQAHFAAENRFSAMFELGTVRQYYKNAPFAWLITMLITLTLALPMYLFKIALPPSDAMWLVTLVFIVTIYPVKIITGWAYYRARHREHRAFFLFRWVSRWIMIPLLGLYVFLLFFTQYIGQHGKGVLFEHHAFLLPIPTLLSP